MPVRSDSEIREYYRGMSQAAYLFRGRGWINDDQLREALDWFALSTNIDLDLNKITRQRELRMEATTDAG